MCLPTAIRSPGPWVSTWPPRAGNRLSITISAGCRRRRILEAVREAKGEHSAQLIDHLKKAEMAKEAERLLDGTGWLPEPLRLAGTETVTDEPAGEAEALPDFLAGEEDEPALPSHEEPARTPSRRNERHRGGSGRPASVSPSNSIQKPGHRAGLSHVGDLS